MATVFYIRKGSKQNKIASSRDISVEDLLGLYGSSPAIYKYMKGADSPAASAGRRPSTPDTDAEHVVVRIEASEIKQDIFPQEGFYRVDMVSDTE